MLRIRAGKRRWEHQINSAHFLRTKEAEGGLCSKRPSRSSYDAFRSRKFKQAEQVDSIKRMGNGFTGVCTRPEHLEA